MLVAARLGHTSTRMVEQHYVSLFEGLDREIGERLGAMRARRHKESERLHPANSLDGTEGTETAQVAQMRKGAEKDR